MLVSGLPFANHMSSGLQRKGEISTIWGVNLGVGKRCVNLEDNFCRRHITDSFADKVVLMSEFNIIISIITAVSRRQSICSGLMGCMHSSAQRLRRCKGKVIVRGEKECSVPMTGIRLKLLTQAHKVRHSSNRQVIRPSVE